MTDAAARLMSTVILSAASPRVPALGQLVDLVRAQLSHPGETEVKVFELSSMPLAYCQGEFDCWVKTPGLCRAHDEEHDIMQAIHDAERLVLVDAVTFGGHSFTLKRAQDRLIGLVAPFFEKRAALTHHAARYSRPAAFYALGWQPLPDAEQARTWVSLADANAVNMLAPRVGAAVVDDTQPALWPAAIEAMLASTQQPGSALKTRAPLREALLQAARPTAPPLPRPRSAAILVGSAKVKGTSASENLARALAARLSQRGIETRLHFAVEFLREGASALAAAQAIAATDLFMLVTPLYFDALPALATHALELVARASTTRDARFALLVNCGFPEPEHNRTAVEIGAHFARTAGIAWAGGLPLGGGVAVQPGVPLDGQRGPVEHIKRALEAAAASLAEGGSVPPDALAAMVKSPLPDAAYRLLGDLGWRYQAWQHGVPQASLRDRPLE